MNDELEKYYQYLKSNKADVPESYDSFRTTLQDEPQARKYFDYLKANKFDTPETYEMFSSTFGLKKKVNPLGPTEVGPPSADQQLAIAPEDFTNSGAGVSSQPIDSSSLANQIAAAVPGHESPIDPEQPVPDMVLGDKTQPLDRPGVQLPPNPADIQANANALADKNDWDRIRKNLLEEPEKEGNPFVTSGKTILSTLVHQVGPDLAQALSILTPSTPMGYGTSLIPQTKEQIDEYSNSIKAAKSAVVEWNNEKKANGAEFTKDLVKTMDDVHDPIDALNYLTQAVSQAGAQIVPAIATYGGSAFGQEIGSIYLESVNRIAQEKGIDPKDVITSGQDEPAIALAGGIAAGAFEYLGATKIAKAFNPIDLSRGLKTRGLVALSKGLEGAASEAGTEWIQTGIEQYSKELSAGKSPGKAFEEVFTNPELRKERKESTIQGALGGGVLSAGGTLIAPEQQNVKAPVGDLGVQPKQVEKIDIGAEAKSITEQPKETTSLLKIKSIEEKDLESYAKEKGLWIQNKKFGKPKGSGSESDIFQSGDGKTITKINSGSMSLTWKDFFKRIETHNELFPDDHYEIKGFTNYKGKFSVVSEQPAIEGKVAEYSEVKNKLEEMGFSPMYDLDEKDLRTKDTFINKKTGVVISDILGRNVIKSDDGVLHFIDPMIDFTEVVKKEEVPVQAIKEEPKKKVETKPKENAIPERSTETPPVGEAPGGSKEVVGGVPESGQTTNAQEKPAESQIGNSPEEKVVSTISDLIGKEKLGKKDIEAIGKEHGIEDKNQIKELTELAIVHKARELAAKDDFEGLKKLYDDQPNLTHRTNESIEKQQYSTPAPIAYLMGKYVNADKNTSNFEPSAGNGMLTIVGKPETYTVNEIDEQRLKNLSNQGFAKILNQSGAEEFNSDKTHDAVITNPPFGGTKAIDVSGYKMNELAQIMSIRGLNTMKDNGKAAIIIGGNNKFDKEGRMTGRDRIFFNYLYHHYNVDDIIDVTGDLYRKQGASFPIRVILVNGRKATPQGVAPLADQFEGQAQSFDAIKERIDKHLTEKNENIQPAELVGGPTDANVSGSPGGKSTENVSPTTDTVPSEEVQKGSTGRTGRSKLEESKPVDSGTVGSGSTESGPGVDGGINNDQQSVPDQVGGEEQTQRPEPDNTGGVEGTTESRPRGPRKVAEGDGGKSTVAYNPLSKAPSLEVSTPSGMKQELLDAQTDLESDVGDVDEFVQDRLGYKTKEDLFNAISAEQIDAVALAIRNVERGTGIIIGDSTGLGKGRIGSSMIRYAVKRGLKPIFITEKPNLFTDLYRDLTAIGSGDLVPFMVNAKGEKFNGIYDENGKLIHKAPSMTDRDHKRMIRQGQIPDDANFVLTTYSQFSSPRYVDKINFLRALAANNIIILDESHNASGEGNTSTLFQEILPNSKGVVYLSGTFAKRADNMPVYALKTSMREANMSVESLVSAVENGGVALQEIISSQLAESGEMIRRERTFEGIDVKVHMSGGDNASVKETQLKQANQVTNVMNDIIKFQEEHIIPVIDAKDKAAVREGVKMGLTKGTNMAGVDNTPYFSKVFNVVNQLLYALKAKDTADLAIEELKAGRKPFIAIRSTMEAMLKDMVERGDVKIGDELDPDFRFILRKGLEGVMKMTMTDPMGNKIQEQLKVDDLYPAGQKEYRYIMSKIGQMQTGLTISPIDEFVQKMKEAGYKVGEVTGRQMKVVFKEGKAILDNNKKEPVNELYRKYNNGELDVLIVNSSGSTGASAHSDKKFKDQRQRSMLVLEPELNISTLVQLLGRVNRTNQINKPQYTFISSHIPAEQRLMMMTMRKLKSLSANTTSNQKQSNSLINVPEIFNKYGDQVVIEYLQENPDLIQQLGNPLKSHEDGSEPQVTDGAANKVTGRVAILPTDKQAEFYANITDSYEKFLQFLNDAGMNDLEISSLPLRAKTLSKKTTILGKGGISKFGEDTFLEEVEADVLKKPMNKVEIDKSIEDISEGDPEINTKLKAKLAETTEKTLATIREEAEVKGKKAFTKAKEAETPGTGTTPPVETFIEEAYGPKATKEESKSRFIESALKFFTPGRVVRVPIDFDSVSSFSNSDAIFLGFDINLAKPKPFLPSNIILKFALNDSRRLINIPASKSGIINTIRQNSYEISEESQEHIRTNWDSLKKPKARGKRWIVTGNVLQGLGDANYKGGQIVKYTTEAGPTETGILMNEAFDPSESGVSKTISVPAAKAVKPITASAVGTSFMSSDALWTILKKSNHRYSLRVPKSKSTGGKYYMDDQINDLVDDGRWDSVGGEMEAFTDDSRLEELLPLLSNKFGTAFTVNSKDIQDLIVESSNRSANTFENFKGGMSTFFPIKVSGKVKKSPSNSALTSHLNAKNLSEAELEAQLNKEIEFEPEIEKRFKEAGEPSKPNMAGLLDHVKDFLSGFKSHFRYLSEKQFPREANILREFEGLKTWSNGQANIYVKGLAEPLTPQQYKILSRRIILADMLGSINKGLNMTGLDGKLPFGFESKEQVEKELTKFETLSKADSVLELAFDKRTDFMQMFKDMMINSGLLSENDIEDYYHRRVLAYQNDDVNKSILFGKDLADKKKDFQKMRTGTRGMDYSTNFIETEFKVVAEGLYELEKQKILNDLMKPYEARLQGLKKQFNVEFAAQVLALENQYGKGSLEVEIKKSAKNALMKEYLKEHLPEGYVFYRVSDENRMFWVKTITQQTIDQTIQAAQQQDATGVGTSLDIIDGLISDLNTGLLVGSKRHQYMIPKPLAEQLEEMAKNEAVKPPEAIVNQITSEWKRIVLLAPNRLPKYSLNNFGGDTDRALQVEPKILKYVSESMRELWDFHKTGKVTPQLLEAMRGSVIDSGFEISELASLSKQEWVNYFLDTKQGPSIDDIFGKKWAKEMGLTLVQKPGNLYTKYMEWAAKYTRLRENVLRYAAYKLAVEKVQEGKDFYWASNKSSIDAITDPRQKAAKLAREVFGDYGNISYTGQWLRRHLLPFYSFTEINMGTTIQLIKNASSPSVQRAMIASAAARGIPKVTVKMAIAWTKLMLFTALIEAWNHYAFPNLPWVDDDDKDAAEKLRRANSKGMQVILYVDDDGLVHTLPIVGVLYDFLDFFGIPSSIDDLERIFTGNDPVQDAVRAAKNIGQAPLNKTFQMLTPAIKMPIEGLTGQTYFPDPQNPTPIHDRGEWFFNALTLKDEYNYFLTDKPQKQNYVERKLSNSLLVRELDPEMLAYYQAKHIISDYTGKKDATYSPTNPTDIAKQKALYNYTLAMRYGKTDEAMNNLTVYFMNGGTPQAMNNKIKNADPFKDLSKTPKMGEPISEFQDIQNAVLVGADYQPLTYFGKSLTPDELLVMKDAMSYFYRMQGIK